MTDKVQYTIVNSEAGNIAVQSVVKSFNLDHVTSKDINSFYKNFSQYSAWDTGLLPVEGSGILSIRTAGEFTQFAYQHKPGLYHVNWSATEGSAATAYYLAQPYRIIICDMKDGNLLGARMFYSPYPITTPSQQLYHVNLPNINCKGYRGNGVGWTCLYQNEDWSSLPLNERIVRFIERCSGVETYNDGNMSETDGTRFYKENGKPSYFWDPIEWQNKSTQEGFEWTLDEDLLIPVLVQSMDKQDKHVNDGVPLTLADALVGDYKAYYYDEELTKPINAIIRPDKELEESKILSYFVKSYNGSTVNPVAILNDTFNTSANVKDSKGSTQFTGSSLTNSPAVHSNQQTCSSCDDTFDEDDLTTDYYGSSICPSCLDEYYVLIEAADAYFNIEDDNIIKINNYYYHVDYDTVENCDCGETYGAFGQDSTIKQMYNFTNGQTACHQCLESYAYDNELNVEECFSCQEVKVITDKNFSHHFTTVSVSIPQIKWEDDTLVHTIKDVTFCSTCAAKNFVCPCGKINSINDDFNPCDTAKFDNDITVSKACASCVSFSFDDDGAMNATFTPAVGKFFTEYTTSLDSITKMHKGISKIDDSPF